MLNENKSVTANVLFDSGLDSTFLAKNVASCLNLNGKEQTITIQLVKSRKSSQNWSTFLCRQSCVQ